MDIKGLKTFFLYGMICVVNYAHFDHILHFRK